MARDDGVDKALKKKVAVIGGGPAGLMAAEILASKGFAVDVYDAMPSIGRKMLWAGVSGLNLTHAEAKADFVKRYGEHQQEIGQWLDRFDADDLVKWVNGLGIETFVGSSQRIFPKVMKAAPLVKAWLRRLKSLGVGLYKQHRFSGWTDKRGLIFQSPEGEKIIAADAVILAMGGGSWARLGGDGLWMETLSRNGITLEPLRPANCGFDIAWSSIFSNEFAGCPVKGVVLSQQLSQKNGQDNWLSRSGDFVISEQGVEGSAVYTLSSSLRDCLEQTGEAVLYVDLMPQRSLENIQSALLKARGKASLSSHWRKSLGLEGVKAALVREVLPKEQWQDADRVAQVIKHLPLQLLRPRPIDEAISTSGGVPFDELTDQLMLEKLPGIFCAGEMIAWDAPTGGYLLTACFASGVVAAEGVCRWLGTEQ